MTETKPQQYTTDFISILHCPLLFDSAPFAADDDWLSQFRRRATIPAPSGYQGNRRLGFYYQWLWKQLIKAHPDYELVAEEIQLQWQKQTVGAIDFLVRNLMSGELEHWEVAIKFYLAYQRSWPGPNAKDNLDKKIQRMLDHQLRLCEHPAYQSQLAERYGQPTKKRLIMQGRLFYPVHNNAYGSSPGSDIQLNPKAFTGLWGYRSETKELPLKCIGKENWISPPAYHALEMTQLPAPISTPVQAVDPDNRIWFIMPDDWPHNQSNYK
nr:DUF1853 family protein [Photobacterium sp. J15]